MPIYLFIMLLVTGSALAQNRVNDPCYAYNEDELSRLPPGVCSEVRGGYSPTYRHRDHSTSRGRVFDPIGEAWARGLRSPYSAREHRDAVNLAKRFLRPAISRAESEIRKGERMAGRNAPVVLDARLVLDSLKLARIDDGGDGCALEPDAETFVTSQVPNTIYVCPKLNTRSGRYRDREVMFILVHEAAHLSGISNQDDADHAAGMLLGWSLN
jgi:hypothetical protein